MSAPVPALLGCRVGRSACLVSSCPIHSIHLQFSSHAVCCCWSPFRMSPSCVTCHSRSFFMPHYDLIRCYIWASFSGCRGRLCCMLPSLELAALILVGYLLSSSAATVSEWLLFFLNLVWQVLWLQRRYDSTVLRLYGRSIWPWKGVSTVDNGHWAMIGVLGGVRFGCSGQQ